MRFLNRKLRRIKYLSRSPCRTTLLWWVELVQVFKRASDNLLALDGRDVDIIKVYHLIGPQSSGHHSKFTRHVKTPGQIVYRGPSSFCLFTEFFSKSYPLLVLRNKKKFTNSGSPLLWQCNGEFWEKSAHNSTFYMGKLSRVVAICSLNVAF